MIRTILKKILRKTKKSVKSVIAKEENSQPCADNMWLTKYEFKEPDLDFVYRTGVKMRTKTMEPLRYHNEDGVWKQNEPSGDGSALIMFSGDITCFDKQFEASETEDGYDFRPEFAKMRPVFKRADLVVGNMETQIVPDAPYRSEKIVIEENFYCNAPYEFLDAAKWAGFDVLTTANNHDIDVGAVGVGETIDSMERFGLIHTGTFKDERKRYELIDVNGIRIAIAAFATDHNALTCNITPEGQQYLLCDYTKEAAEKILNEARQAGAEVVFASMHWGKENWTEVYKDQYTYCDELITMGYDCIIGSHPHVLQKFQYREAGGRKIPVFFSLGNFVSQNFDNIKARSIIACIRLTRKDSKVEIGCSYIPISTCKKYKDNAFVVLPFRTDTKSKKNKVRIERIINSVGTEVSPTDEFVKGDYREDITAKIPKKKVKDIDLSEVKEYPFEYNDGHFIFTVYEDHVKLDAINKAYRSVSCTVPEFVLGLPVTDSENGVFENNDHLKKIKAISLPYVPAKFCKNAKELEGFRMGMKTSVIKEDAFAGCTSLYSAVMKRGLKRIKARAFKGCTNLKSVKLPNTVKHIADSAFDGCDRVVFYCGPGSFAEQYAKEHGIKVTYMDIYGPASEL